MIADLVREDPDCKPAIEELLREIFPYTAAVFVPPAWDERYVTAFGFTLEEIFTYGAEAMEARFRAAGLEPETMRVGMPFDLPAEERARRGLAMLRAGYLGEPNGAVKPDAGGDRAAVRRPQPSDRHLGRARRDDPMGLHRRRAVARADHERRGARPSRAASSTPT